MYPKFHSNFKFNLGLLSRKGHINVTMVTHIKGDVLLSIKTFSIIFQVSVDRFFKFFQVFEIILNLSMK